MVVEACFWGFPAGFVREKAAQWGAPDDQRPAGGFRGGTRRRNHRASQHECMIPLPARCPPPFPATSHIDFLTTVNTRHNTMHSFWNRLNSVLTFFGTVAALLCLLVAFTDVFHNSDPPVDVQLKEVKRFNAHRGKQDQAMLSISLKADLSSAFSWNTKQLFVFLQAEYETDENDVNQISLWDTIIERKEDAVINLKALRQEYAMIDQGKNFRGMPFNLTLTWDVMPKVGYLYMRSKTFAVGPLPDEYIY